MFSENKKLVNLIINKNKIKELHERTFSSQVVLKTLDLSNNEILKLPRHIFKPLSKLQKLDLHGNKIRNFLSSWLEHLQNLRDLDLSYNLIINLPAVNIQPSEQFKKLSLRNNNIRTLQPNFFKNFKNLEILLLSNNEIYDILAYTFSSLTKLRYLWLKGNKLRKLSSKSFGANWGLRYVNLDNNELISIDRKFGEIIELSKVSLVNHDCGKNEPDEKEIEACFRNSDDSEEENSEGFSSGLPEIEKEDFKSFWTENCGKKVTGLPNIILGQNVPRGAYPWVVALVDQNDNFFCGGTLVTNMSVITAAHCLKLKNNEKEFLARDIKVLAGVYDLKKPTEVNRLYLAVKAINIHHNYNPHLATFDADIAFLELESPILYNQYIQPICMISEEASINISQIETGIVVGYGMDEKKVYGEKPKMFKSPIINRDECFAKDNGLESLLSPRMFCGGNANGTGTCVGDSGSGLFVTLNGTFYLRGIVSASLMNEVNDCNVHRHSVFTDTLPFRKWIEYNILKIYSSTDEKAKFYKNMLSAHSIYR